MCTKWMLYSTLGMALLSSGSLSAAPSYTLYGVGGSYSGVWGLNDLGQATGHNDFGDGYVWTLDDGLQSLGINGSSGTDSLGRGYTIKYSYANDVNNAGQVTGYAEGTLGSYAGVNIPFIWEPLGGLTIVPLFSSPWGWQGGEGLAINHSGEVAGHGQRYDSGPGGGLRHDALYWDGALATMPVAVSGLWNELTGINGSGLAVGWGQSPSFVDAFMWDKTNGATLLGKEAGTSNYAFGVNDLGHAVGSAQYGENGYFGLQTATLWYDPLSWIKIGDLAGGRERSEALAINDRNQVVGWGTTEMGEEAFYWDELAGLVSLAELVDENLAGWTLLRANAINDSGWIGGTGINPQGGVEGFVLIPDATVPIPATVALFILGLVGIGCRRHKLRWAG